MKTTRRTIMTTGLAAAATVAGPGILRAQTRPPAARTIRAVPHGDIPTYDPIWTTANMSAYHGAMVYDTLFGIDANLAPQPQMVSGFGVSEDKLTWTFELRDGLRWSDGSAVTSADAVPSIRRWAVRSGSGQLLLPRIRDVSAKDDKTFIIALKEPFPLLLDMLASSTTPLCFIMRKREAETDPMQKIDQVVGSGPFILNAGETKAGNQYVYDKNPNYVPRGEPPSGIAGGKVVKVDRVIFQNMPDSQTAVAALQAGEIDFYEIPPIDLLDQLQGDPNITVENLFELGAEGYIGLNWLHPPFDNQKLRQALLYIVKQEDMLRPTFVDPKWYRTCGSWFACGSPIENDANTAWFKGGQDLAKARALMKEGGYDGRPVVMLQATNIPYMMNAATVMAQQMRSAGFNVQLAPMDWANVVQRRSSKAPPDQGGWNIFFTSSGGLAMSNPYMIGGMATIGDKGWFGWPTDERNEQLRDQWLKAETLEQRKVVAAQIQDNAWNIVPHMYYGQWVQPTAHRKNVTGWLHVPEVIPFWNVVKT
ncbi:ABC transporter substrate-binding protein [Limobrevibacterium gyesilva]|uniref:ABC transporter substrate-binding protein n=1 Tax=Limobrevibacterium gyesilva TaxID=2991712 RepID=A0AA42CEG8_9PROT|nr:ABC transporter substrate-binding protein [Limobrevibacterium gyesilva]MCW3475264.1 ABC transporter substrate-binding protein [Limobrevibacterium gyesilva]